MSDPTRSGSDPHRLDPALQVSGDQRTPFVNYYEHTARHTVTDHALPLYPGHTEEEEGIYFTQDRLRVSLSKYGYPLAHSVLGGRLRPELPRDSRQYSYQGALPPNCLGPFSSGTFSSISPTVQVHNGPGRPVAVHLLYTPTGEMLYWDDGMRIGGFFSSSNAVFYPTVKRRSPDHRNPWVEFSFENVAKATIGVRHQDLSFALCQSSKEVAVCQTVFRVGPNPSEEGNYVAFEIAAMAQGQSETSKSETYYWTNSNGTIVFVTEDQADIQQVRVFKITTQ